MNRSELEALPLGEVVAGALADPDPDGDARWAAVHELRRRGDDATFHASLRLCRSGDPDRRRLGADVLAQLGYERGRPFLEQSLPALLDLAAHDPEPCVARAAVCALGHLGDSRAIDAVLRHAGSPDAGMRWQVAAALPGIAGEPPSPRVVDALLGLMQDGDADVRDWATFGVGSLLEELDTPAVRDALAARLDDPDGTTREEALYGLAVRHDPRAFPAVVAHLGADDPGVLTLEAAAALGDPRLLPHLLALAAGAGPQDAHVRGALADAIDACREPAAEAAEAR